MPPVEQSTVLVVGASRGLGLALALEWLSRGCRVIATARGTVRTALHEAADASEGRLTVEPLEMTDPEDIVRLRASLAALRLDTLFVNAGVANGPGDRVDLISTEEFTRVMVTNALSPMRVVEQLGPLVAPGGTIAAMSSSLGSVALNDRGGWEVYRASKAALNTLMRSYAARQAGGRRRLALIDPGWVRTDMGGASATLSVDESVPRIVDVLSAKDVQPGLRYVNYRGEAVSW